MKKYYPFFAMLITILIFAIPVKSIAATASNTTTQTTQSTQATQPTVAVTPPVVQEAASSDLVLLQAETILNSTRWVQSFAKDNNFYYFVQMINPNKGNLRVTRVRYLGPGRYLKDHMDLYGFGHGTNIDCSVYKGKTYLWIGSCMNSDKRSTAISVFEYRKNAIYQRKAGNTYSIRMKGRLKKATNVFPAVSSSGKYLYVRYTYKHKQYFQKYKIYKGNTIKPNKILGCLKISTTAGDFQGFDATDKYIYTIEGSPSAAFLAGYDKTRKYEPTIIRRTNFKSKSQKATLIRGASYMAFREPEGIKINKNGSREIMFVSNTLTFQKCNIYRWK